MSGSREVKYEVWVRWPFFKGLVPLEFIEHFIKYKQNYFPDGRHDFFDFYWHDLPFPKGIECKIYSVQK